MRRPFVLILGVVGIVDLVAPSTWAQGPEAATTVFFGPRAGVQAESGKDISTQFGASASVGAELGLRFHEGFFVGAQLDHAFVTAPEWTPAPPPTTSGDMTNVDAVIGLITRLDRVGGIFQVGGGYRHAGITDTSGAGSSSYAYNGVEGVLGAGVWIPFGRTFRLVPRIDVAVGTLADDHGTWSGFTVLSLGVTGYFNFGLR